VRLSLHASIATSNEFFSSNLHHSDRSRKAPLRARREVQREGVGHEPPRGEAQRCVPKVEARVRLDPLRGRIVGQRTCGAPTGTPLLGRRVTFALTGLIASATLRAAVRRSWRSFSACDRSRSSSSGESRSRLAPLSMHYVVFSRAGELTIDPGEQSAGPPGAYTASDARDTNNTGQLEE